MLQGTFDKPDREATLLVNEARMVDAEDGAELALLENTWNFRIAYAPQENPTPYRHR